MHRTCNPRQIVLALHHVATIPNTIFVTCGRRPRLYTIEGKLVRGVSLCMRPPFTGARVIGIILQSETNGFLMYRRQITNRDKEQHDPLKILADTGTLGLHQLFQSTGCSRRYGGNFTSDTWNCIIHNLSLIKSHRIPSPTGGLIQKQAVPQQHPYGQRRLDGAYFC